MPPKDYVTGEYAAIKRFRLGQHGLSHRNPKIAKYLPQNAIVAYSKSSTFENHLSLINKKIPKLAKRTSPDKFGLMWSDMEHLQKIKFSTSARLKSEHQRINKPNVILHHFWVHI